jgi:predicted extracellular nuclease
MWELIGQQTHTYKLNEGANTSTTTWNPNTAYRNPGRYDSTEVEGRISIPSHSAGAVLGKGGVSIKSIGDVNGVVIAMNSKDEGEATRERIVIITGEYN